MSATDGLRPIERNWREYREQALPKRCSSLYVRTARLAFYAAVSATLAELVAHQFSVETIERMADELDGLLREAALERAEGTA